LNAAKLSHILKYQVAITAEQILLIILVLYFGLEYNRCVANLQIANTEIANTDVFGLAF